MVCCDASKSACGRRFCSLANPGLACVGENYKAFALVDTLVLFVSLILSIVGVFGVSAVPSIMDTVPWGAIEYHPPPSTSVDFGDGFEIHGRMNIWGQCLFRKGGQDIDLGSGVNTGDETSGELCSSWADLTEAVDSGLLPGDWDCESEPMLCYALANGTATVEKEAFNNCKDAVTGLQITLYLAVVTTVIKFLGSLRAVMSPPEKDAKRNKCCKLALLLLPVFMKGSAVGGFINACYAGFEPGTAPTSWLNGRSLGAGASCFIVALALMASLFFVELLTPSTWPDDGDESATVAEVRGPTIAEPEEEAGVQTV